MEDTSADLADLISQVPNVLLEVIVDKLPYDDYLRFSATCRSHRRLAKAERRCQKPWLMLSNEPGEKTRRFYSPLEDKIYKIKLPKVVRRSWCCGSYKGWLVLAHKTRGNFIFNPFTKVRLNLPSHLVQNIQERGGPIKHTKFIKRCPYMLSKIVLSTPPPSSSSSTCPPIFVAAITENYKILVTVCGLKTWRHYCPVSLEEEGGCLNPIRPWIFINPGHFWKDEEEEVELYDDRNLTDIIFYQGKFYVVRVNGSVYTLKVMNVMNDYDFSLERVYTNPLKLKRKELRYYIVHYLVESIHGELLLVIRLRNRASVWVESGPNQFRGLILSYKTEEFRVFKLDKSNGEPYRWARVESLGNQILFLGQHNYSHSISSHEFQTPFSHTPQGRGNCIYFTDYCDSNYYHVDLDGPTPYHDTGVYHLDDGSIHNLLPPELDSHVYNYRRPPVMFTPNSW